jgi:hypothetical protein
MLYGSRASREPTRYRRGHPEREYFQCAGNGTGTERKGDPDASGRTLARYLGGSIAGAHTPVIQICKQLTPRLSIAPAATGSQSPFLPR